MWYIHLCKILWSYSSALYIHFLLSIGVCVFSLTYFTCVCGNQGTTLVWFLRHCPPFFFFWGKVTHWLVWLAAQCAQSAQRSSPSSSPSLSAKLQVHSTLPSAFWGRKEKCIRYWAPSQFSKRFWIGFSYRKIYVQIKAWLKQCVFWLLISVQVILIFKS